MDERLQQILALYSVSLAEPTYADLKLSAENML